MSNFSFQVDKSTTLNFELPEKVFVPTGTSSLLVQAFRNKVTNSGKLLDLGCGAGVTGITLCHLNLVKEPLCASDLSEAAVVSTKKNAMYHECSIVARTGSLFEPWKGETFDYIVNDVSGIAQPVAEISPWFEGVSCLSGEDGTLLISQILENAKNFLNPGGLLFFPVLSLSKTERILEIAKNKFSGLEKLVSQTWPMPSSMMLHIDLLLELNDKGLISVEHKFGTLLWFTDIYVAHMS